MNNTDPVHEFDRRLEQTSVNTVSVLGRILYTDCPHWRNTEHVAQRILIEHRQWKLV